VVDDLVVVAGGGDSEKLVIDQGDLLGSPKNEQYSTDRSQPLNLLTILYRSSV